VTFNGSCPTCHETTTIPTVSRVTNVVICEQKTPLALGMQTL